MANEVITEGKRQLTTDYSKGIFGTSDNFLMAMQMAKALSSSTIVPREYQNNPSNCLIAIEQAQRLNMSPMMVMQNLYPIQGRPSWSSKFLIAMINNSGKYDSMLRFDEVKDKSGKPYSCTAWAMKDGERIDGMEVNMDIAAAEGWLSKNGSKWKTMPQLMLRYRAASFFSSLNCPEITMGMYTSDEIQDSFSDNLADVQFHMEQIVDEKTASIPVEIPEKTILGSEKNSITSGTIEEIPEMQEMQKTTGFEYAGKKSDENNLPGQMAMPGF